MLLVKDIAPGGVGGTFPTDKLRFYCREVSMATTGFLSLHMSCPIRNYRNNHFVLCSPKKREEVNLI